MRKLIPIVTTGVLLVGGVGAYGADQALTSTVVLSVDGQQTSLRTYASSVGQALAAKHIEVGEHDTVAPPLTSRIADGSQISVRYGRPVTVTIDGTQTTIWTTATTVDEALGLFGVDKSAVVSTSRSTTISREGLAFDVSSAHKVTVTADGSTATITASGTVAEALMGAGITLGATDEVTPALSTPVAEGTGITVVRVTTRTVTKTIAVPYTTSTTPDATLAKGTTKVKTSGVRTTSGVQLIASTGIFGVCANGEIFSTQSGRPINAPSSLIATTPASNAQPIQSKRGNHATATAAAAIITHAAGRCARPGVASRQNPDEPVRCAPAIARPSAVVSTTLPTRATIRCDQKKRARVTGVASTTSR